jgi:elongation factor 1 alpha-like protein
VRTRALLTAEQMAVSFGIAKSLLGDLKVSDDDVKDSLWHYWFDAEKAVNWLKAQNAKKSKG